MSTGIEIVGYDPRWPQLYEEERRRILDAIGNLIVTIEHIGSTAVPDLAAKPIIDLMAAVHRLEDASLCVEPLETLGYEYVPQYEVSIPERRYFRKPTTKPRTHHLHIVETTSEFWRNHLQFRDFLRNHPEAASEYAELKRQLATRYGSDGFGYTEAKTPFVKSVLARASASA
jgi:GrpB-like predicted nucleotidyltransferase (UPF0157 family)